MSGPGRDSPTVTTLRVDAAEVPAVRLEARGPAGEQFDVPLGMQPITVGSDEECDLVLADGAISRRHCSFALSAQGVRLRDLGSKNGTFVGAVRVLDALVTTGDEVRLGSWRIGLAIVGAPTTVALSTSARFGDALGGSVVMRALFAQLERVARSDATVLLVGESGTGKEVLAKGIHQVSARATGPFVVFDCAAVAPNLVESELFGHARGAFTGATTDRRGLLEQANAGTLFIDELGELPLELQPKLLRALEDQTIKPVGGNAYRPVDVRIVAATHRDLRARIREGSFREDLFFRIAVVEAHVAPLRQHKEDIVLLVERFLADHDPPRALRDVPKRTLELLEAHDWPGNVRELRNAVTRLLLFPDSLPGVLGRTDAAPAPANTDNDPLLHLALREAREVVIERFEDWYIRSKLREHTGNVTRAAAAMGVSRQLVHRLMERYGIRAPR
ncbi:MAG TPA: sigma 54-interacting transcriptional regulator [Polyangiaceae bacterium]|nr:sigma 54-interacting transcriptional regulator [Polyangiaceae bacterium]